MKKQQLFIFVTLFVMACTDIDLENQKVEKIPNEEILGLPSATITKSHGILCFSSINDYKTTLDELQSERDAYVNNWLDGKDTIPDSTLMDLEITYSINYDQPLIDFETYYEFSSLRQMIDDELEDFLNQENPNWDINPDDIFIEDEIMRSVLSTDWAVKIGNSIFIFRQNGGWFEITDGSFATMDGIIALTIDPYTASNVVVEEAEDDFVINKKASNCNSNKTSKDPKSSGNSRICWYVMHKSMGPNNRYVKAITKNYVKDGNRWRKYTAFGTIAQVKGFISGVDGSGNPFCDIQINFNEDLDFNELRDNRVAHKIFVQTKTRPNWIQGYHKGVSDIEKNSVLTW